MFDNESDIYVYKSEEKGFLDQFEPLGEFVGINREVFLTRMCPKNHKYTNENLAKKLFPKYGEPSDTYKYHWNQIIDILEKYREKKIANYNNDLKNYWHDYYKWLWNEEYEEWEKKIESKSSISQSIYQNNYDSSTGNIINGDNMTININ